MQVKVCRSRANEGKVPKMGNSHEHNQTWYKIIKLIEEMKLGQIVCVFDLFNVERLFELR